MAHFSTLGQRRGSLSLSAVCPGRAVDGAPVRGERHASPVPGLRRLLRHVAAPLLALTMTAGAAQSCADLALILAIDASGSVDPAEFRMQQQGYAKAFRSRRVQGALAAAGTVDVGVVIWGDTAQTPQVEPMVRLQGRQGALALADRIAHLPRRVSGNTGIGRGISAAIDLLDAPGTCALRRVINVSGDGVESRTPRRAGYVALSAARERAGRAGIVINALAIRTGPEDLGSWYADRLIIGPGAFVMQADGFGAFAAAIEAKLVREIAPPALSALSR